MLCNVSGREITDPDEQIGKNSKYIEMKFVEVHPSFLEKRT